MAILKEGGELSKLTQEIDKELESILKKQCARIKVVGVGGAGNNTVSRIKEIGIKGGEIIAINTDAQDLLYTAADKKVLIGRQISQGAGAGSNPRIGMESAKENAQDIKNAIAEADLVFITCGLGGGTGTGAAPVIAEISKKQGSLTIGIVTLPFSVEGKKRIENATEGLERLETMVDTLIIIPNDKLLELAPGLPLPTAFKIADEILINAVKGITEMITRSGLVNLDFADVRAVMSNGGVSLIGLGESNSNQRAIEAVERALINPLLDVKIENANGALINVMGGEDLSLEEYKKIMELIGKRLSAEAKIISGAQISPELKGTVKVMVIITGIKSKQISGKSIATEKQKSEMEEEFGIEFIEQ